MDIECIKIYFRHYYALLVMFLFFLFIPFALSGCAAVLKAAEVQVPAARAGVRVCPAR